eukprot:6126075-Ditylum_brightwellii.AAC.1
MNNISLKSWCTVPVEKPVTKLTTVMKHAMKDWIFNHDHVKISICKGYNDGDLAESHNDNGKVIIVDSNSCKLLPPNIKSKSKLKI